MEVKGGDPGWEVQRQAGKQIDPTGVKPGAFHCPFSMLLPSNYSMPQLDPGCVRRSFTERGLGCLGVNQAGQSTAPEVGEVTTATPEPIINAAYK